eukprot:8961603-Prorocentrum_lima.AAC.1
MAGLPLVGDTLRTALCMGSCNLAPTKDVAALELQWASGAGPCRLDDPCAGFLAPPQICIPLHVSENGLCRSWHLTLVEATRLLVSSTS